MCCMCVCITKCIYTCSKNLIFWPYIAQMRSFFFYCLFNRVLIHATYRAVHGQPHPSFRFGQFACSCNSSESMHVMRKWGWNQRWNLGCETTSRLGGDTVTRWCYSNLFGRQSYAETEGLMSQSSWSEFGCRHYVLPSSICMPLKSWMGTTQETSKKLFRVQVQRWPFVHIGRCKMEKQILWLHNWAGIWMSFPFLLCV